jgi:hypothetical protein
MMDPGDAAELTYATIGTFSERLLFAMAPMYTTTAATATYLHSKYQNENQTIIHEDMYS